MSCPKVGVVIKSWIVTSPIGPIVVRSCSQGIHSVQLQDATVTGGNFDPKPNMEVEIAKGETPPTEEDAAAQQCMQWLRRYFEDPTSTESVPYPPLCVAAKKDSFREKVWLTLAQKVPSGQTVSYSELSKLVGNTEGAARAVGSAMAKNPVLILVPCHRVIRHDGSVGHFACGSKVKQWLLAHETKE